MTQLEKLCFNNEYFHDISDLIKKEKGAFKNDCLYFIHMVLDDECNTSETITLGLNIIDTYYDGDETEEIKDDHVETFEQKNIKKEITIITSILDNLLHINKGLKHLFNNGEQN